MAGKGSAFEREFCKELSLWWTNKERDDVFWRSQTSGGRATSRRKKGMATAGQYGDVAATDAIGIPLIERVTIELKRGYKDVTIAHAFGRPPSAVNPTPWEQFYLQARQSATDAGTPYWWLVTRRDKAKPLIWMPRGLWKQLHLRGAWKDPRPCVHVTMDVLVKDQFEPVSAKVSGTSLSTFFRQVTPDHILDL